MRRYILFTVFISGMTTLAAELAASRLIGNVFGTSNIVWASIIGLILIYLTLGYFLGGKWADANPTPAAMYRVLAWGAFTLGLVPYIAGPVLRSAASAFEVSADRHPGRLLHRRADPVQRADHIAWNHFTVRDPLIAWTTPLTPGKPPGKFMPSPRLVRSLGHSFPRSLPSLRLGQPKHFYCSA